MLTLFLAIQLPIAELLRKVMILALAHGHDLGVETRAAGLGLPGLRTPTAEEDLDLLERLAACLGVGEVGLDGGAETEDAELEEVS